MKVGNIRKIRFNSLTFSVGFNGGVIFDADYKVTALARVVIDSHGKNKWKLVNKDLHTKEDIACLSLCEIDDVEILKVTVEPLYVSTYRVHGVKRYSVKQGSHFTLGYCDTRKQAQKYCDNANKED